MADRYLIVRDGTADPDPLVWDGVTPFTPPDGGQLVREQEWKGPRRDRAATAEETNERDIRSKVADLRAQLRDDLKALDTMTAAQRAASQRRLTRAVLLLARIIDREYGEAGE